MNKTEFTVYKIKTPLKSEDTAALHVGDRISITGKIYTGRDTALPKLVELIKYNELSSRGIDLEGSVIFHTAVSPAGLGPTSSNKEEIEANIPLLAKAGVRIHLGKGALSRDTIKELAEYGSIYAVIPPVTALLESKTKSRRAVAFEEDKMEAMYEIEVEGYTAIVAVAHGESIYK